MIAALVLVAASLSADALPPLPQRGLALETTRGVQLQTLHGRSLGTLPGLDLAPDRKLANYLVLRDGRGRLFTLDFRARAVRRSSPYPQQRAGCRETDTLLFVCGRTIRDGSRVVARAPGGSPVGYGRESSALGFLPDGSALIHFPNGPCGGGSIQVRGIYAVPPNAEARLVLRTPRFAQYGMWGG